MTVWTDKTIGVVGKDAIPNLGIKMVHIRTPATFVNGTDTLAVTLSDFGLTTFVAVLGFEETTAGSVSVPITALTTSVTNGVLTIATTTPANTCVTDFIIFGY